MGHPQMEPVFVFSDSNARAILYPKLSVGCHLCIMCVRWMVREWVNRRGGSSLGVFSVTPTVERAWAARHIFIVLVCSCADCGMRRSWGEGRRGWEEEWQIVAADAGWVAASSWRWGGGWGGASQGSACLCAAGVWCGKENIINSTFTYDQSLFTHLL